MPVTLEHGQIGSVQIDIPLLQLLSRPVRVVVEHVVLKLRIQSDLVSDNEALATTAVSKLTAVVDALQERATGSAASRSKAGRGFGSGLLRQLAARVMWNVELKLADVHVCVWDDPDLDAVSQNIDQQCPTQRDTLRWVAGVRLGEIHATNSAWRPAFGKANKKTVHKASKGCTTPHVPSVLDFD